MIRGPAFFLDQGFPALGEVPDLLCRVKVRRDGPVVGILPVADACQRDLLDRVVVNHEYAHGGEPVDAVLIAAVAVDHVISAAVDGKVQRQVGVEPVRVDGLV